VIENTDSLDEIIKEVAAKHEFVLSRDDPVLLVYTIQQRLLADSADGQQLLFDQFREELEQTLNEWEKEATSKLDQALDQTITAAKTDFRDQMRQDTIKITAVVDAHYATIQSQIREELKKCQRSSNISLVAEVLTLAAVVAVLWNSLGYP
jgi:transcription termination factor NusB